MRRLFIMPAFFLALAGAPALADIAKFFGSYTGTAKVSVSGKTEDRDMGVVITETDKGFQVKWTSIIRKADGRVKTNEYTIGFVRTQRDGIYSSAMKSNVFGKAVPLDPLKGDPYVWSRLSGDTLSLFSMLIDENGSYTVQEYHRTLTEGGLDLDYRRLEAGEEIKMIKTFLIKS